jgi:hypothetical protein
MATSPFTFKYSMDQGNEYYAKAIRPPNIILATGTIEQSKAIFVQMHVAKPKK